MTLNCYNFVGISRYFAILAASNKGGVGKLDILTINASISQKL